MCVCVCVCVSEPLFCIPETNNCKSTILQFFKKLKKYCQKI